MSARSEVIKKLKQFGINLDYKKIGTCEVEGKRSTIFEESNLAIFSDDDYAWEYVLNELKGKRVSCYQVSPLCYHIATVRSLQDQADYEGEREWSGTDYHYAQFTITSKSTKKSKIFRIGLDGKIGFNDYINGQIYSNSYYQPKY